MIILAILAIVALAAIILIAITMFVVDQDDKWGP